MLKHLKIDKLLFIDIETVPEQEDYDLLQEEKQVYWTKKAAYLSNEQNPPTAYPNYAGIYAEFGKIICIVCGEMDEGQLHLYSFAGDNEKLLLEDFNAYIGNSNKRLCGHNIKEFDIPYICRRMMINNIALPNLINIAGKKPWEVNFVDTLQLWKFGDYKAYTSLDLLCHLFHIPSPKDKMDGSKVAEEYWINNNLAGIIHYCQKDVISVARLIQKWQQQNMLENKAIHYH